MLVIKELLKQVFEIGVRNSCPSQHVLASNVLASGVGGGGPHLKRSEVSHSLALEFKLRILYSRSLGCLSDVNVSFRVHAVEEVIIIKMLLFPFLS